VSALRGLLRKEFFHIRRDRRTAAVLVALPVVQVLLFGYAIRTDVDDVRLAVVDPAPDSATIALRNRFTASNVFRTIAVVPRIRDLDPLFESGKAQQAIVFSPGFAENLGTGVSVVSVQALVTAGSDHPHDRIIGAVGGRDEWRSRSPLAEDPSRQE